MYNSREWADLHGEDGIAGKVDRYCHVCEHLMVNEQCVNVHCKNTDIAYVCEDCSTGWLEDNFPGELCPECGGDIRPIGDFGKQEL